MSDPTLSKLGQKLATREKPKQQPQVQNEPAPAPPVASHHVVDALPLGEWHPQPLQAVTPSGVGYQDEKDFCAMSTFCAHIVLWLRALITAAFELTVRS